MSVSGNDHTMFIFQQLQHQLQSFKHYLDLVVIRQSCTLLQFAGIADIHPKN